MTSGDIPIQVVVAAFRDEYAADEALDMLRQAQKEKLIKIDDAAVLRRDQNDTLHIRETADMGGGKGAVVGGVTGAALGLLAGPVGWATGIGALVGGLAAKARDVGFPDARLRQLGQGLKPGTSAIVAVVEHTWVRQVEKELAEQGADVITERVQQDIARQLEAGRDVAYTALSASGAIVAERDVSGQGYREVELGVATDSGVYLEGMTADNDRVVGEAGVITGAGVAAVGYEAARVDPGSATGGSPPPEAASDGEQRQAGSSSDQPPMGGR